MATWTPTQSPFTTISEWKFNPETNTGRYEPKTFVTGMEQDPMKRYADASAAKGNKTVWDEASKTYRQAPVLSISEFNKTDPFNQMMGTKLAYSNAVLGAQQGGTMMSGTNLAKLDASLGTLRNQLVPGVGGPSAGGSGQQSTSQQQGSSTQSSQGGGGGGVSGIDFEFAGGDPRTGAARPKGYQGNYDPLYDPKYAFWNKGIPSKFYDPVDPSKPMSFPEQTRREREARARWIGAMTDAEFSFYMRSLNKGAGSAGQEASAMRQAAKNPPVPEEQYGDPNKGQPGPIGLKGPGTPEITKSTSTPSSTESTSTPSSTKSTGLGQTTTARKLPTRARRARRFMA